MDEQIKTPPSPPQQLLGMLMSVIIS